MGLNGSGGKRGDPSRGYVTRTGIYAYGVLPEVEDLFQRQAREIDRAKREALLHQIQRILHERVMHVPIYELSPMAGVGPRVEQAAVGLIPAFRTRRRTRTSSSEAVTRPCGSRRRATNIRS